MKYFIGTGKIYASLLNWYSHILKRFGRCFAYLSHFRIDRKKTQVRAKGYFCWLFGVFCVVRE